MFVIYIVYTAIFVLFNNFFSYAQLLALVVYYYIALRIRNWVCAIKKLTINSLVHATPVKLCQRIFNYGNIIKDSISIYLLLI